MTGDLAALAAAVDDAARFAREIPQLTAARPGLTVADAYAIQGLSVARRYQRGERRIGMKMGLTSRAKMVQVGVSEMIWGRLTDAMLVEEGASIALDRYVHPRVEPEVAFLLKAPLAGRVTAAQALAAVEAVAPALEIIDSRYQDFKFTLTDVIADNSSSSGLVVGGWRRPDLEVGNLGLVLEADGRPVQIGSTAAILGHPLRSLVAAARLVAAWDHPPAGEPRADDSPGEAGARLEAGSIVLAGGITAAHPLARGMTVRCIMQDLGAVSFQVES